MNTKPIEILLVEDSPSDRLLTTAALEHAKILNNLHAVDDGVEAMAFLRREAKYLHAPRPDLILLDLNLPRKDGREVLAEIKTDETFKRIPVVVLTTSQAEEDVLRVYGLHANCYIAKPVEFDKFAEVVRAIESFWFNVVTLPTAVAAAVPAPVAPVPAEQQTPERDLIRVLLCEDNPTEVLLLGEALHASSSRKFQLENVARLGDAVKRLAAEKFDVILTDLGLPDSQGLETFSQIHAAAKGTPVIVLTSLDDEELGAKALHLGAQDYLVKKEVTGSVLPRAIRYAMERRQLEEQLRQSQRMEAIGQLAGGVAHDFNNILTIVQGHTAFLMAMDSMPAASFDSVIEINKAAERAAGLTRQLLAYSRKQVMQLRHVDLNEVIGHVSKMLNRLLGDDIRLQLQYSSSLPLIRADVGMIEQILLNLAVNSRDAMPNGGKLTIKTGCVKFSREQVQNKVGAIAGEFSCLTVHDTGAGIPAETLPRIFEPFFTTKEVGKGTGLGLATVFGIVKQHGGWIDVESEPNKGTTFSIYLPVSRTQEPQKIQPKKQQIRGGTETVLVVEDETDVRNLLTLFLKRAGYRPLEATHGFEALEVWKQHRDQIDLLITDLVMPDGMTGRELAERLQADKQGLKVIITSGYSPDIFSGTQSLKPRQHFVQKPYSPSELLLLIRDTLDQ